MNIGFRSQPLTYFGSNTKSTLSKEDKKILSTAAVLSTAGPVLTAVTAKSGNTPVAVLMGLGSALAATSAASSAVKSYVVAQMKKPQQPNPQKDK